MIPSNKVVLMWTVDPAIMRSTVQTIMWTVDPTIMFGTCLICVFSTVDTSYFGCSEYGIKLIGLPKRIDTVWKT